MNAPAAPVPSLAAPAPSRRRTVAAWTTIFLVYLLLRLPGLLANSATYDEPIYIGASKHWAAFRDDRAAAMLYHPPLSYHLIDLPLLALDSPIRPWDPSGTNTQAGLDVLYGSSLDGEAVAPETVLLLARLPILAVGALGVVLMAWLGRRLGGPAAGWICAAAWAAFPDGAAQCIQATTDCVAAVAALFLAYAALRFADEARDDGRPPTVLLGFAAGAALLAKHTLLVHVAVVGVALLVLRAWTWRRLATVAAGAAFVVWAGYLFEFRPAVPATGPHETLDRIAAALGVAPSSLEGVARAVPLPCPTYFRSVLDAFFSKATARSGTPWVGYMNGEWSAEGFWTYFPFAILVKTPVSLLALTAAGLAFVPRLMRERRRETWIVLALFAVPFAAAVVSRLNIGCRHLLPTLPFLFVVTIAAFVRARPSLDRPLAVVLCGAVLAAESLGAVRDPLPFANAFAGGPATLHRRLADSNLEMGQDLGRVRDWARANGVTRVLAVLHGPPGLYERECVRDGLFVPFGVAPTGGELRSIVPGDQRPERLGNPAGVLAVGESVVILPRWNCLLDVPPVAVVGRTRIYVRP